MAAEIFLDREGADACIKSINEQIQEIHNAAERINTAMNQLRGPWRGVSADKAQDRYDNEYKSLITEKVPAAVNEFKEFIDYCMNEIVNVDQSLGK